MIRHFNPATDTCGHGITFRARCIKCEIVTLQALVRTAQANIERWTRAIAELEMVR